MSRWVYLHPLLAAVAPILFLVAHNPHEADAATVLGAVGAALLLAAVVFAAARFALADLGRASLLTFIAMVLFHAYGRVFDWAWPLLGGKSDLFEHSKNLHVALAIACTLVLLAASWRLRTSRHDASGLSKLLTTFGCLMALSSTFTIAQSAFFVGDSSAPAPVATRPDPLLVDSADHPDVYYVVLDGYARQDVLKKFYRYDNASFIKSLRARGFYVADNSRSAYVQTFLSLTSTLEMEYMDKYYSENATEMEKRGDIYKRLHKHKVGSQFQSHGYRYVHFNTNFSATQSMKHSDIAISYLPPLLQSEFVSVLTRTTMLRPLEPDVASMYLFMLEKVKEVPAIAGPTFTFLHLLMPHNPYVFDKNGNVRSNVPLTLQLKEKTGGWTAKREYLDQLRYVNKRVLEIIDVLIAKSTVPPVIILQSDHGSASSYRVSDSTLKRAKTWHERTATLNAWYAPPAVTAQLTDNMVSVNTFRLLFSALFGDDLPQLPRKVNFSWYSYPYRFLDVTRDVEFAMSEPAKFWNLNSGYAASLANDTAAPMVSDPGDTGLGASVALGTPP